MIICIDQQSGTGCQAENPDGTTTCQNCGRSLKFALVLHNTGTLIGNRYRIVRCIGHGGFGAVYEAEDTQQGGRLIAIKETFDPANIRAFRGEFETLRNLQHDHLPDYCAMFETADNGYLVMELVPGQSLLDVLERQLQQQQPLKEAQVLGYAVQVCDALTFLHTQASPIFHRDIKPANIRLTPDGLVKLVDFGLLKQGTDTTGTSRMGLTPAYAACQHQFYTPLFMSKKHLFG